MCDYLIIKSKIRPYLKYYLLTHKEIPKHIVNIIDQTPPITLENTLALPLENFKIIGKTFQTQLTGKNLLEGIELGDIRSNTGLDVNSDTIVRSIGYIPYNTTDTYYLSKDGTTSIGANLRFYNANKEYIGYAGLSSAGGSNFEITVTTTVEDTTPKYMRFRVQVSTLPIDSKAMVATTSNLTFEPYCGGVPSPNPDFPQEIENVEGNVTIKVANGNDSSEVGYQEQTIIINLGDIELCKIGEYQDKIYKENDKWYIRKEIGKYVYDNDLTSNGISAYSVNMITPVLNIKASTPTKDIAICNMFQNYLVNYTGLGGTTSIKGIRVNISLSYATTYDEAKAIYSANNLTIYFVKEIAEDIEITDTTLISQLEQLETLTGYNNITIVDATSSNLTPNLSFDYYAKGR